MSDNDDILGTDGRSRLTADITYLMLKGAGYALVACLAVWALISVLVLISKALPAESQEQLDPNVTGTPTLSAPLAEGHALV